MTTIRPVAGREADAVVGVMPIPMMIVIPIDPMTTTTHRVRGDAAAGVIATTATIGMTVDATVTMKDEVAAATTVAATTIGTAILKRDHAAPTSRPGWTRSKSLSITT